MDKDQMLVDPKCHELADYFLNPDPDSPARAKLVDDLAGWIQYHVELWLYDDRSGALDAAMTLGDK